MGSGRKIRAAFGGQSSVVVSGWGALVSKVLELPGRGGHAPCCGSVSSFSSASCGRAGAAAEFQNGEWRDERR